MKKRTVVLAPVNYNDGTEVTWKTLS